jgi:4-aminobutyrate aminotransferase-like enzyme
MLNIQAGSKPEYGIVSAKIARGDFVYRQDEVPIIAAANGSFLTDTHGRVYLDAESENGAASLGYDHGILREAVDRIADIPSAPAFCETRLRLELAEKLGSLIEDATGMSGRLAFELGGAQGMELALKVVQCNTKRSQYAVFEGGYHGRSGYMSQFSASHRYRAGENWRLPIVRLPYPDCSQCRFQRLPQTCDTECLTYVQTMVTSEIAGMSAFGAAHDVAALIIEPILNAGGVVKPDPRYIQGVVDLFRSQGALIVLDEIFCGFHRTGPLWGFMQYDIKPDVIVFSKAITNGLMPFSGVWGRDPLMAPDAFPSGSHSSTYCNNVLSIATAHTVLDRYERWPDRVAEVGNLGQMLKLAMDNATRGHPMVKQVQATGGVGRILLSQPIAGKIVQLARDIAKDDPIGGVHGLILLSSALAPNVIAVNPPLNISAQTVDLLRQLLAKTFDYASVLYNEAFDTT